MKNAILITTVSLAMIFCSCNNSATTTSGDNNRQTFNLDTTKLKSGETFYQCEMDPEVISDKPGNCPKCGMELVETKKH